MGSSQSTSSNPESDKLHAELSSTNQSPEISTTKDSNSRDDDNETVKINSKKDKRKKKNQKEKNLSTEGGAAWVEAQCRKPKVKYNKCYRKWYSSGFTGVTSGDTEREDCDDLFELYKECYVKNMLKDRMRKNNNANGADSAPKEGSLLATYMDEIGDDDDGDNNDEKNNS